jgi:hypothetical protein
MCLKLIAGYLTYCQACMEAVLSLNNNTIAIQRWYVLLAIEPLFLKVMVSAITRWLQKATSLSVNVANILVVASFCTVGIGGGGKGIKAGKKIRAIIFSFAHDGAIYVDNKACLTIARAPMPVYLLRRDSWDIYAT